MFEQSARLMLPFLQAAQAQKHVTHNEALERLDMLVQLVVEAFDASTPPLSPSEGQIWALGGAVSGDWSGHANDLASWLNGGWLFVTPQAGWRAAKGTDLRVWSGSAWDIADLPALQNLDGVGVNTTYDATNRLSVSAPATLLTHEGADHRLKINKAAQSDTASLLFQTGWSGRAEMGTTNSDDFAIKVSDDGSVWSTALRFDAADGKAHLPAGAALPDGTPTTPALHFDNAPGTGVFSPTTDTLALATDGTERVRLSGSAMSVSVPVTGTAVTQTNRDTTAGRLAKVGDAGWLETAPGSTTLGASLASGAFSYAGSAADASAPSGPGGTLLVQRHGVGYVTQFAQPANNWAAYKRYSSDGGTNWSGWSMFFGQRNVLGAVSQSAGVPTGALIEQGTNANGSYARFADGTQMCWHTLPLAASAINVGYLGGFRNAGQTWLFPATFIAAPPMVTACPGALTSMSAVISLATPTASSVFHTAITAQPAATLSARVMAVGRWF